MANFSQIFFSEEVIAVLISVPISVSIYQLLIPFITFNRDDAKERLDHFYGFAHSFIKMREGFSAKMDDGKIHNKKNCGLFHNFNIGDSRPIDVRLFREEAFFEVFSYSSQYVTPKLSELVIDYLKLRIPAMAVNRVSCNNKKLIELRKEIENKIIEDHNYFFKISKMNPVLSAILIMLPFNYLQNENRSVFKSN